MNCFDTDRKVDTHDEALRTSARKATSSLEKRKPYLISPPYGDHPARDISNLEIKGKSGREFNFSCPFDMR